MSLKSQEMRNLLEIRNRLCLDMSLANFTQSEENVHKLADTLMKSSEIRRLKLISKDIKYLVEKGGRHLCQQSMHRFKIYENPSGCYKIKTINNHSDLNISIEDFLRIFAFCRFEELHISVDKVTLDFCDQLQKLREEKISCRSLIIAVCGFNENERLTAIDRLLSATGAKELCLSDEENDHFDRDFFSFAPIRELEVLSVIGVCDFSDEDLEAGRYLYLYLDQCSISEHGLRRILKELLECKRHIGECYFGLRHAINVDRLLDGLPNLKTGDSHWNLRNTRVKCCFHVSIHNLCQFAIFVRMTRGILRYLMKSHRGVEIRNHYRRHHLCNHRNATTHRRQCSSKLWSQRQEILSHLTQSKKWWNASRKKHLDSKPRATARVHSEGGFTSFDDVKRRVIENLGEESRRFSQQKDDIYNCNTTTSEFGMAIYYAVSY
uniref:F-box only protein 22 n=1 Tax=Heterorhabditis bacteriophora TaxID=37862 RepID=A0A1I7WVA1_HETBA